MLWQVRLEKTSDRATLIRTLENAGIIRAVIYTIMFHLPFILMH
jgi:hypothetical protein